MTEEDFRVATQVPSRFVSGKAGGAGRRGGGLMGVGLERLPMSISLHLFLWLALVLPCSGQSPIRAKVVGGSFQTSSDSQVEPGQFIPLGSTLTSELRGGVIQLGPGSFLRLAPESVLYLASESEVTLLKGGLLVRSDREIRVVAPPLDALVSGTGLFSQSGLTRAQSLEGRLILKGTECGTVFGPRFGASNLLLPAPFWAVASQYQVLGIVAEEAVGRLVLSNSQELLAFQLDAKAQLPGRGALVEAKLLPVKPLSAQSFNVIGQLPGAQIPTLLLLNVFGAGGADLLLHDFPKGI